MSDAAVTRFDRFTSEELTDITGGTWQTPPPAGLSVTGVTDNSRGVRPGMLFVAIRGENTDGHRFAAGAAEAGAAAILADRAPAPDDAARLTARGVPVLLTTDSLAAFQALAHAHRMRYPDLVVVGITGSCGKTSTKEMLAAVLDRRVPGAVLKTEGNTNNHFGVPRNLLRLGPQHRAAVIEMGTNHPGEIALLARLAQPRIGVISNIGHAHLEFFHDLEGVAREKGELFVALPPEGVAVCPAGVAEAGILRARTGNRRLVTYGPEATAPIRVEYLGLGPLGDYGLRLSGPALRGGPCELRWGLGGRHQALNAGAAAAVGTLCGLEATAIAAGLRACALPKMRMEIMEMSGVHWVNDAYNANLDSVLAGLEWFGELTANVPREQRLIVLGEMRELGAAAADDHRDLLVAVRRLIPDENLLLVGAEMAAAVAAAGGGLAVFPDWAAARPELERRLAPGQWVLLKGSNGVHLENLLPPELRAKAH